jgi:hypothetical protein
MHPCAYLLENVPPLGDSRPIVLASWQHIRAWIDKLVQVNVALIDRQLIDFSGFGLHNTIRGDITSILAHY